MLLSNRLKTSFCGLLPYTDISSPKVFSMSDGRCTLEILKLWNKGSAFSSFIPKIAFWMFRHTHWWSVPFFSECTRINVTNSIFLWVGTQISVVIRNDLEGSLWVRCDRLKHNTTKKCANNHPSFFRTGDGTLLYVFSDSSGDPTVPGIFLMQNWILEQSTYLYNLY